RGTKRNPPWSREGEGGGGVRRRKPEVLHTRWLLCPLPLTLVTPGAATPLSADCSSWGARSLERPPLPTPSLGTRSSTRGRRRLTATVGQTEIYGRRVTVVDTPPWVIPTDPEDDGEADNNDNAGAESDSPPRPPPSLDSEGPCMGAILCPPGPHAILLVVSVTQPFTDTQRRAAEDQLGALGGGTWRYSMVVFTGIDKLPKGVFIEEHIANTGEGLQWLVERCGSRYHAFDNTRKETEDNTQVPELMEKVEEMITDNQG
uniref:AIG1-type G domain-containing protein n=1 Tax=Lates calcarifer TaxID=8187 RepID=A0A4W6D5N6_LATCA